MCEGTSESTHDTAGFLRQPANIGTLQYPMVQPVNKVNSLYISTRICKSGKKATCISTTTLILVS